MDDREVQADRIRMIWASDGHLSPGEIRKLVRYEFYCGAETVAEQVERYYLMLKSENPKKAEQLDQETTPFVASEVRNEEGVEQLCAILTKYWSGFVINLFGRGYSYGRQGFQRLPSYSRHHRDCYSRVLL